MLTQAYIYQDIIYKLIQKPVELTGILSSSTMDLTHRLHFLVRVYTDIRAQTEEVARRKEVME